MKAMILNKTAPLETSPLELVDLPVPQPGPGEILLRVSMCGLCHTDIHTIEGDLDLPVLPIIPGHQIVGTVIKTGPGVASPQEGTRVGSAWLNRACGSCSWCQSDRENLCQDARFTGFHVPGGYAEYTVLPADFVYPLPENFSDRAAAPLLCAGIIGYRSLRLCGIKPGGVLGLYGFGASAHVSIQIALYWNCKVLVFTRSEEHREHARKLGAFWAGSASDQPPIGPQASIIFAPAGELIPPALKVLERGGTVALAGITMTDTPPLDYEKHLYHEKVLRSVANSTRRDGLDLVALAARIPIETTTTLFPLEEANQALLRIKESRISGAGVLRIRA
ncbi:MAG: zinc-dependent alcohol dehydrogenase family protein [Candidatus Krumholzibacteriota bacterium]|nr:zinc-dependent alcohol dehydrogenase family protein [Candidatus Krumholzibacteriota bacterium]